MLSQRIFVYSTPLHYLIRIYVSDIYIYCHTLSIFVYSTPLADKECACVAKVAIWYVYMWLIYMYIATIRLPNSACQNWECNCVDEVACSMYVHESMDIVATVYTYCCYLKYVHVSDIHIYIVTIRHCWNTGS